MVGFELCSGPLHKSCGSINSQNLCRKYALFPRELAELCSGHCTNFFDPQMHSRPRPPSRPPAQNEFFLSKVCAAATAQFGFGGKIYMQHCNANISITGYI
jgi:hypothetical protein